VPGNIAAAVTSLFLGDNNLTSAEGVAQFANVRALSLANNLIARLEDLEPLRVSLRRVVC
jgi:Leucine-rich repeat (LRR) protein